MMQFVISLYTRIHYTFSFNENYPNLRRVMLYTVVVVVVVVVL
jgi:hypothetical protein